MGGKVGKPSIFSDELAEHICTLLADGGRLSKICEAEDMPHRVTVAKWLASKDEKFAKFQEQYMLARRAGALLMGDDILDISDDGTIDKKIVQRGDEEVEVVDHEHIQRSKLRVDSRKFLMARYAPDVFGERMNVAGVKDAPIETKDATPRDIGRRIAFLLMGGTKDKA